ncbi:hypothetical protein H4R34_006086 [Dimargaris verticillata]|uniref:Transforming acidic coiled-coil-containing protein C-terminal domain-containing protein n=1 Tax=Dimargaris verticillata TaxID=2761393 RepID=A0A9W8B147_9FUNG|nr:hypothetical protein H4R34_006086 [Dimargaris verticillata]
MQQAIAERESLQLSIKTMQMSIDDLEDRCKELKDANKELEEASVCKFDTNDRLKAETKALKDNVKAGEDNFDKLKTHAESKIQGANDEIAKVRTQKDKEISLLKAQISRAESKIASLDATIETKTKENQELMTICDELMTKMSG